MAASRLDARPGGFYLDALPDNVYLAHFYGARWNGWAAPIVDCGTLASLLRDLDVPHRWTADIVHVSDEEDDDWFVILGPDAASTCDTAGPGLDVLDGG